MNEKNNQDKRKMMMNRNKNGLKGQHNRARGNALGLETIQTIVRPARQGLSGGAIRIIEEKNLFRTREMTLCFRKNMKMKINEIERMTHPQHTCGVLPPLYT